jgi:hypothetical protein
MRKRTVVLDVVSSLVELAGVGVVSYGFYQVYRPLGWLLGGAFLALAGFALSPKPGEKR